MSADVQDMMAKLQVQLSGMNNQPSFAGLQAPVPTQNYANALNALKQQNFMAGQNQPTQGAGGWGFLHDAGRQAIMQAGQQTGNMLGNALGAAPGQSPQQQVSPTAPQTGGDPTQSGQASSAPPPPGTPQYAQWMSSVLMQSRQITNSLLQSGKDPITAQMTGLQFAASRGVPGASDKLVELQQTQTAEQQKAAGAAKDTAQAANFQNESANRDLTQTNTSKKDTWTTVSGDPANANDHSPVVQVNGNGEVKVNQKANASVLAAASVTPDAMQAMHQYYQSTGNIPPGLARSPAMAGKFWEYEAQQAAQNGDTATTALANKMSNKANGDALTQTQKQYAATSSYFATMDKNISAASSLAKTLNFGDVTTLNKAEQAYLAGTSDPQYAKYNVFFDSIANEYAKIKSGSLGNAPVSDSARREAMSVLAPSLGQGGAQAAFDAIKQEGNNRLGSLQDTIDMYQTKLGKKPPQGAAPPPPGGPAAPAATSGGWGTVQKVG